MKSIIPGKWFNGLLAAGFLGLGLANARAGDVTSYGVGKEQLFEQSSAANVLPDFSDGPNAFTAFTVPSSMDALALVTVTPAGGDMQFLNSGNNAFSFESTFGSPTELDAAFPSGPYTFTFDSALGTMSSATLSLSGSYPATTPQLTNFALTQGVDPSKDLALAWNGIASPTADDFVELALVDENGDTVFDTGLPGQPTALAGTARTVTIPANTLSDGATYQAALTFGHITSRDSTSYPGATGFTTFANQTRFTVMTTGGTGGIPTGVPPLLIFTSPTSGAKNVPVDSPIVFTFSTPMSKTQSISWSPNVTPANFSYTWDAAATNLTAKYNSALPANALITWTLDPTAFKSQSGTALFAFNLTGSFTTGSGGSSGNTNSCSGSTNSGAGLLVIAKSIDYIQTNANPPVIDSDLGARFFAEVMSPVTNPVTQATLLLPNGSTKTLTNLFGTTFAFFDQFSSQQALDTAYPAGSYTITMVRASGTALMTLSLLPNGVPPTPQISNLAQLQSFDPTADLTAQWLPFTGVTTSDFLSFDLNDTHGTDFQAPDLCIPRPLANTATSILVPKNTFGAGATIEGSLMFEKSNSSNTNSIPGIRAFAYYAKTTSFKATTSGGTQSNRPTIENFVHLSNGTVEFQVKGTPGAVLTALASSDLTTWVPVASGLAASGVLPVTDTQAASMKYRFYKAMAQ